MPGFTLVPIMSAKTIRIGTVVGKTPKWPIGGFPDSDSRLEVNPLILLEDAAVHSQTRHRPRVRAMKPLTDERWENASYFVLWLCGIISIGLAML